VLVRAVLIKIVMKNVDIEKIKQYIEYNFQLLERNKKLDIFLLIFGAVYPSIFIAITGYFYLSFVGYGVAIVTYLIYTLEKNRKGKILILSSGALLPMGVQIFMVGLALVMPQNKSVFLLLPVYLLFLAVSVLGFIALTNKKIKDGFYANGGKESKFGVFQPLISVAAYIIGALSARLLFNNADQEKLIYYVVFPMSMLILCVTVLCSTIPAYKYYLLKKLKNR